MDPNVSADRIAVMIDADNTRPSFAEALLSEVAKYGTPTIKRVYGDWTNPHLTQWSRKLNSMGLRAMHQNAFTMGKNSTDLALVIDAMDLLYDDNVEAFALVTSDSDFTSLAHRLRESGKTVYVLGENKAPDALKYACDKFIDLEVVQSEEQSAADDDRDDRRDDDSARDDADVAPGADDQPAERPDPRAQRRLGRRGLGQPRGARQPAQPDPPLLRRAHLRRQHGPAQHAGGRPALPGDVRLGQRHARAPQGHGADQVPPKAQAKPRRRRSPRRPRPRRQHRPRRPPRPRRRRQPRRRRPPRRRRRGP